MTDLSDPAGPADLAGPAEAADLAKAAGTRHAHSGGRTRRRGTALEAALLTTLAALPIASLLYCALFLALNNRERQAPSLPHEGWQV